MASNALLCTYGGLSSPQRLFWGVGVEGSSQFQRLRSGWVGRWVGGCMCAAEEEWREARIQKQEREEEQWAVEGGGAWQGQPTERGMKEAGNQTGAHSPLPPSVPPFLPFR